jgi:hypothetical protein
MSTTTSESDPQLSPAAEWSAREAAAEKIVPLVGRLFCEHGVITAIYGRSLINPHTKKILKLHRFARHLDVWPNRTTRGRFVPLARWLGTINGRPAAHRRSLITCPT